ncbi:type II toxin-antitoxin system RelE/ParE family toxin [Allosphingosinicella flava]|uniref:Type II toxin-antitoxin system RelE/ParE family toxin n=1 Tax=Allosphingosinicella flava TaxID=2771430 RepID=A0A7T2LL70_9SPHN|nr:type II toxin-antitoxin system RelE/ParE family toxin [Sphingosinicella flava]QPQ54191.1 type II toxin-antitoxin system RelE/ParE family toxin [Sphingosinicella flava]
MRRIQWSAASERDLEAIDDYWSAYSEDQADAILDRIREAGDFLAGLPFAGSLIDVGPARKWRVKSSRYVLIYRLDEQSIQILRVRHDQENWADPE